MEELKIPYENDVLSLTRELQPLFPAQPWGSVFAGKYDNQNVIIKSTFVVQPKCSNENPERERKILEEMNSIVPTERIFMKLLCYLKTEKEHLFILERAKMDLYTFLLTKRELKQCILLCRLIVKLTNRLHVNGYTHCDISPENIVIYTDIHKRSNVAFIDAAQVQKPDFSLEFHVNVSGKTHEFDNRRPGKEAYELPQSNFGEPFSLVIADIFAVKKIMWEIIIGIPPFVLDPKNPKNIKPYENRLKFLNGDFELLISQNKKTDLGSIWIDFSDFLRLSTRSFNLNHPFLTKKI